MLKRIGGNIKFPLTLFSQREIDSFRKGNRRRISRFWPWRSNSTEVSVSRRAGEPKRISLENESRNRVDPVVHGADKSRVDDMVSQQGTIGVSGLASQRRGNREQLRS